MAKMHEFGSNERRLTVQRIGGRLSRFNTHDGRLVYTILERTIVKAEIFKKIFSESPPHVTLSNVRKFRTTTSLRRGRSIFTVRNIVHGYIPISLIGSTSVDRQIRNDNTTVKSPSKNVSPSNR